MMQNFEPYEVNLETFLCILYQFYQFVSITFTVFILEDGLSRERTKRGILCHTRYSKILNYYKMELR